MLYITNDTKYNGFYVWDESRIYKDDTSFSFNE